MKAQSVLLRIARALSDATPATEVLEHLAQAAFELTGAVACGVFQLARGDRLTLVAQRGLPASMERWSIDDDALGAELGDAMAEAAGLAVHGAARVLPLIASGNIFGAVVLCYRQGSPPTQAQDELARGLVDLAASALEMDSQHASLARAHGELRATQDVLARTEKLRALGEMAAGMSHDLKNIVAPLALHLQLAQRSIDKANNEQALEAIAECRKVVQHANGVLERLRDFSRQAPESRVDQASLDALVCDAIEISKPRMSTKGGALNRFVEQLGAPPTVRARATEVVSAIVNLIVNAIDAAPAGSTITVTTGVDEQRRAFVSVKDDGPGMDAEMQSRVFQPFFTSKGEKGTGLGLAMVYACMQRHGGAVGLKTAPGEGATFTLYFPIPLDRD